MIAQSLLENNFFDVQKLFVVILRFSANCSEVFPRQHFTLSGSKGWKWFYLFGISPVLCSTPSR